MPRLSKVELAVGDARRSLRAFKREFCGEKIGRGLYRDVFVFTPDPRYVVKIERDMGEGAFANALEWRYYIDNREYKKLSDWLAPCELIDETGRILVQRRVRHRPLEFYPKYVPAWFTDFKITNYGWIGRRFVCCDYSFLILTSYRMKRAKWWDLNARDDSET